MWRGGTRRLASRLLCVVAMHDDPLARAHASLLGVSVGDAFGTMLDAQPDLARRAAKRLVSPQRPWRWTDDTAMAISIVAELAARGVIDPDSLAARFATTFYRDPDRGYGAGAATLLARVAHGADWALESAQMFRGTGSFGNGAAMRAAPLGAYFADQSLDHIRNQAILSAAPTHQHSDGLAGAIAVALAAALVRREVRGVALLEQIVEYLPPGETRKWLGHATRLSLSDDPRIAGEALGTGGNITAADTVPFALWVVARSASFEEAAWHAAGHTGEGTTIHGTDRDTLGAIVGGIMARTVDDIPLLWREATEPVLL